MAIPLYQRLMRASGLADVSGLTPAKLAGDIQAALSQDRATGAAGTSRSADFKPAKGLSQALTALAGIKPAGPGCGVAENGTGARERHAGTIVFVCFRQPSLQALCACCPRTGRAACGDAAWLHAIAGGFRRRHAHEPAGRGAGISGALSRAGVGGQCATLLELVQPE